MGFCKFKSAGESLWPLRPSKHSGTGSVQDHPLDHEVLGSFTSCVTLGKRWASVSAICPRPVEGLHFFIFLLPGHLWKIDKKMEGSTWGFHE